MEYNNRESETVDPFNNTTNVSTSAGDILAEKRRRQNHLQQEQLCEAAASESTIASTTRPGAVHIQGRGVSDHFDDSDSSESTETTSLPDIFTAQVVDEEEMQGHAELIFQQMLAQAAVVAEVVDEDEMHQRAREQATLEIQEQQQRRRDQEEETADGVPMNNNNNNKQQQQGRRLRIILAGFLFLGVITIAAVASAVFLDRRRQQRERGDAGAAGAADLLTTMPTGTTPSEFTSFSPSTTPSAIPSFSPSTPPSSMPSASSSWWQIGNSINGIQDSEQFGWDLGFSADGNTVVGVTTTDETWNGTHSIGDVRAYTYHNETGEWKQLGQYITRYYEGIFEHKVSMSPNGKFLGVFSKDWTGSKSRIFALRDNKTKMNATTEDDVTSAMFWEQLGPDIVYSFNNQVVRISSLTDNLVFAIGFYNDIEDQGLVHTVQFDANRSDWVRMGQEIQMSSIWSMQLVLNKSTERLFLAVGERFSARTFWYDPDTDSWIPFGSKLISSEEIDDGDALISLSRDGETITIGSLNIRGEYMGQGIEFLRTFSYDAATDDWIQLGKDLNHSSFLFGPFSLSANGKVLVTTTQKVDIISDNFMYGVTGQVRTWDFIANDESDAAGVAGGEWIQREAALEVGTLESYFGYKIALSADGNRLATSAIYALNDQGVAAGTVRVFEQY